MSLGPGIIAGEPFHLSALDLMTKTKNSRPYAVRHSAIHGRGVFAARAIAKDEPIVEYRGERTTWARANRRPSEDPDNPYHTFVFGLDDGSVIDASVGGNAARWINHSCKPNCEARENGRGRVYIHARRKIREGEELTYDYGLIIEGKVGKRMRKAYECRCGARKCRGTMLALQ
jgi:SET domain-containing protein